MRKTSRGLWNDFLNAACQMIRVRSGLSGFLAHGGARHALRVCRYRIPAVNGWLLKMPFSTGGLPPFCAGISRSPNCRPKLSTFFVDQFLKHETDRRQVPHHLSFRTFLFRFQSARLKPLIFDWGLVFFQTDYLRRAFHSQVAQRSKTVQGTPLYRSIDWGTQQARSTCPLPSTTKSET